MCCMLLTRLDEHIYLTTVPTTHVVVVTQRKRIERTSNEYKLYCLYLVYMKIIMHKRGKHLECTALLLSTPNELKTKGPDQALTVLDGDGST